MLRRYDHIKDISNAGAEPTPPGATHGSSTHVPTASVLPPSVFALIGTEFSWKDSDKPSYVYAYESLEALQARADISEFTIIDPVMIEKCWRATDKSLEIKVASDYIVNALFSGEVKFKQVATAYHTALKMGGYTEKEIHRNDVVASVRETAMSTVWTEFARELMTCCDEIGFAAVVYKPHKLLGFEPRVLDLTLLEVRHHNDIYGHDAYLYRRKAHTRGTGGGPIARAMNTGKLDTDGGFLPGVLTFTRTRPLRGRIHSTVSIAILYREMLDKRKKLRDVADTAAAMPVYYTEKKEDALFSNTGIGIESINEDAANALEDLTVLETTRARIMTRLPESLSMALQAGTVTPADLAKDDAQPIRIDLPPGRKYVAPSLPIAPGGVTEDDEAYWIHVAQLWGIPPDRIVPSRNQTYAAAVEASAQRLTETLSRRRKWVERALYDVYHVIYDRPNLMYLCSRVPIGSRPTDEELKAAMTVHIHVAGITSREESKEMYTMGILKTEAIIDILVERMNLPRSAFNEKPKPPQTEWEAPQLPAAGGLPKKKKKKSTASKKK